MTQTTPRGRELLRWIEGYVWDNGYAPNLREMMAGVGLKSTNEVRRQLLRLEQAGRIRWTRRISRGVVLTNGREATQPETGPA